MRCLRFIKDFDSLLMTLLGVFSIWLFWLFLMVCCLFVVACFAPWLGGCLFVYLFAILVWWVLCVDFEILLIVILWFDLVICGCLLC